MSPAVSIAGAVALGMAWCVAGQTKKAVEPKWGYWPAIVLSTLVAGVAGAVAMRLLDQWVN